MTTTSVHRAADGYSGFAWLVAGMTAIAFIWCVLFPRLLRCGPVASHVGLMEQRQVNPAAMYYTELDRLPLRPAWVADRVTLWPAPSLARSVSDW